MIAHILRMLAQLVDEWMGRTPGRRKCITQEDYCPACFKGRENFGHKVRIIKAVSEYLLMELDDNDSLLRLHVNTLPRWVRSHDLETIFRVSIGVVNNQLCITGWSHSASDNQEKST